MRVGSLFTGYGGLDMAVGGDVVWYSEIEPAACKILAEHYPGVPNLGDITVVDWSTVEPVDVITGGYPCQPFSTAGMRRGKNDDRHLWPYVRNAISTLRPAFAVLENVRGHLSMGLADVIGDLAGVGYDARWGLVRASDAGAPHGRARVFIVAYPDAADTSCWIRTTGRDHSESERAARSATCDSAPPAHAADAYGKGLQGLSDRSSEAQTRSNRHTEQGISPSFWGQYESAITQWESITRPAPQPTVYRTDRERLNPRFVEWMMGLPEGHVTGRGLSAAQELKMLGNGVCPQQAALALRLLGAA
jgi:DNA (cytosine-5)-methyltransferase 1